MISNLFAIIAFLCLVCVNGVDYDLAIEFPYSDGHSECSNEERVQIHHGIQSAMIDSGYESRANSKAWMVYDNETPIDITSILDGTAPEGGQRNLGDCAESFCYIMCQTQGTYCECCPYHCGCGHGRRMLRVLNENDLAGAVDEMRVRVEMATTQDSTIQCVDTQKAQVIVKEVL